jgi:pyrroloquinoline quinone biosynthesis protein D
MSERILIGQTSMPRLAPHARLQFDKQRDRWIVQAPERLFVPDPTALEILQRCDGAATVQAIIDGLAEKYSQAPREVIERDVSALLQDLADKGVLTA